MILKENALIKAKNVLSENKSDIILIENRLSDVVSFSLLVSLGEAKNLFRRIALSTFDLPLGRRIRALVSFISTDQPGTPPPPKHCRQNTSARTPPPEYRYKDTTAARMPHCQQQFADKYVP